MMRAMSTIILYTRRDCHLCREMEDLLAAVVPRLDYESVDIEPDLALTYRYGTRIPVLKRTDNQEELDWPADADGLIRFLGA